MSVGDGELPSVVKIELEPNLTFQLKTRIYRIREVVTGFRRSPHDSFD